MSATVATNPATENARTQSPIQEINNIYSFSDWYFGVLGFKVEK